MGSFLINMVFNGFSKGRKVRNKKDSLPHILASFCNVKLSAAVHRENQNL